MLFNACIAKVILQGDDSLQLVCYSEITIEECCRNAGEVLA